VNFGGVFRYLFHEFLFSIRRGFKRAIHAKIPTLKRRHSHITIQLLEGFNINSLCAKALIYLRCISNALRLVCILRLGFLLGFSGLHNSSILS
jgi:hypothetical protein